MINDQALRVAPAVKTLRLKVRPESYPWLEQAAREVNFVWNWANETSEKAVRRFAGPAKWLSAYDLDRLSAGASREFDRINGQTISRVNARYAQSRREVMRPRLSWRRSGGSRRSLGWIPFDGRDVRRAGKFLRYAGKTIRVFQAATLEGLKWKDGQFAQDTVGDWWLCLPVELEAQESIAPNEYVGIDLGLKDTATTSDGERLVAGRYFRDTERRISDAQRRGHKRQAKRMHRKAARQRRDALHKFTTGIVVRYQTIIVGDVSSPRLAKSRMAKSVLDSGWGLLRQMLQYKGQWAGRTVEIVNEKNTTRACSSCGCLTGPSGLRQLALRAWRCSECGAEHDRDVNAARNIAMLGSRHMTSVCGNEQSRYGSGMNADDTAALTAIRALARPAKESSGG